MRFVQSGDEVCAACVAFRCVAMSVALHNPSSPPPPQIAPVATALEILDQINARFLDAVPSSDPQKMGVMVHSIDGFEHKNIPWRACEDDSECGSGAEFGPANGGRISVAAIFNHWKQPQLPEDINTTRRNIPLFGSDRPGFVINPVGVEFFCGYPGDGDVEAPGHTRLRAKKGNMCCWCASLMQSQPCVSLNRACHLCNHNHTSSAGHDRTRHKA